MEIVKTKNVIKVSHNVFNVMLNPLWTVANKTGSLLNTINLSTEQNKCVFECLLNSISNRDFSFVTLKNSTHKQRDLLFIDSCTCKV